MYTSSMSEIAKVNEQQPNNASQLGFQSNKSEVVPQAHPGVQSETFQKQEKEGGRLQYKKLLLKLMVEVRLENMGFAKKSVKQFASDQNFFPQDLENAQLNELTQIVNQIVNYYISQGFSQPSMGGIRFNRIQRSRRSSVSQHIPQRNINVLQVRVSRPQRELIPEGQIMNANFEPIRTFRQILCSICYTLTTQFSQQSCNHSFCDDCFRGFINENISSGTYIFNCPEYNCTQKISTQNIRRLIGSKSFERYIYFKQKNEKQLNPHNRFCSKPDCGEILSKNVQHLKCFKCESLYCEVCLQRPHQGRDCDEALKNAIDQTFQIFKIKKCPNCKAPIEKSQGCNHMNCKKCKHEFCWVCLKPYSHYHYKYYNCFGCPGMQFQDQQDLAYQRSKQILFYVGLPVIISVIILCYFAIIPIYMIGCFLYKPCMWIQNNYRAFQTELVSKCQGCLPQCISIAILYFLFLIRSALYAIFLAPIKITGIICGGINRVFFQ